MKVQNLASLVCQNVVNVKVPCGLLNFTITVEILPRAYWLIFIVNKRTDT